MERAHELFGNRYDYSEMEFVNSSTKIKIICPEHGPFYKTPSHHLEGQGCPKCARENGKKKQAMPTEEFIKRADAIHGGKYDYSKVKYKNRNTKITIICPVHGEFEQLPYVHLRGSKCSKYADEK